MNCMKCGRETPAEQVFCEDCLLEMDRHPVKPGTVVFLPRRSENTAPKKVSKRRALPLEDQVRILKKRVKLLAIALGICLALILAMAYPSVQYLMEDHFKIGQNYTAVTTATVPTEAAEAEN